MTVETDPIHGWPLTGYRCRGCKNAEGNGLTVANCPHYKCPVMRNIDSLTPTITATRAAEIVGLSAFAMLRHCKAGQIPGAYFSGCWQVPREQINKHPITTYPLPPGNPNCKRK